jgi:hypothetical protein
MSEMFAIDLPKDLSAEEQGALVASLREIDDVEEAKVLDSRIVDLATITVGVQLATQIGSAVGPVIEKVIGVIRGRRIKGVKISFPDGMTIAVDEISGKELKQLLELVGK